MLCVLNSFNKAVCFIQSSALDLFHIVLKNMHSECDFIALFVLRLFAREQNANKIKTKQEQYQ